MTMYERALLRVLSDTVQYERVGSFRCCFEDKSDLRLQTCHIHAAMHVHAWLLSRMDSPVPASFHIAQVPEG